MLPDVRAHREVYMHTSSDKPTDHNNHHIHVTIF